MTVVLESLALGSVDARQIIEPLQTGPTFIVKRHPQRHGRLWHRPRSGYLSLAEWHPDEVRTIWHLWCGQSAQHVEVSDEPPLADPVCATCEGRAAGAGQIPGPAHYRVQFTSHASRSPIWCPASGRTGLWAELPGGTKASSAARCLLCGSVERVRCMGGFYTGGPGLTKHHPATEPLRCPIHAWRHLSSIDGQATCRCGADLGTPERAA